MKDAAVAYEEKIKKLEKRIEELENKMKELINDSNRTVVIVSHSSKTLIELCDRFIWLHEGLIKDDGDPEEVMTKYEEFMRSEA